MASCRQFSNGIYDPNCAGVLDQTATNYYSALFYQWFQYRLSSLFIWPVNLILSVFQIPEVILGGNSFLRVYRETMISVRSATEVMNGIITYLMMGTVNYQSNNSWIAMIIYLSLQLGTFYVPHALLMGTAAFYPV